MITIQQDVPTLQKMGAGQGATPPSPTTPAPPVASAAPPTVVDNDMIPDRAVADINPTAPAGPFRYIRQLSSPGGREYTPLLSGLHHSLLSEQERPCAE